MLVGVALASDVLVGSDGAISALVVFEVAETVELDMVALQVWCSGRDA